MLVINCNGHKPETRDEANFGNHHKQHVGYSYHYNNYRRQIVGFTSIIILLLSDLEL